MRIKVSQLSDVVRVGDDPIVIVEDKKDTVDIVFEIGIDLQTCIKNNIQLSKIRFFTENVSNILPDVSIDDFRDGLRSYNLLDANEKSRIQDARNSKLITEKIIDITSFIPNDKIKSILSGEKFKKRVIKINDSNLELLNQKEIKSDEIINPEKISTRKKIIDCLNSGLDPITQKFSFPLNDVDRISRGVTRKGNPQKKYDYRIVGNKSTFISGELFSKYYPCIFKVEFNKKDILQYSKIYLEVSLHNSKDVLVNRMGSDVFFNLIRRDINDNEIKSTRTYARTVGKLFDTNLSNYFSVETSSVVNGSKMLDNGSMIIREILGEKLVHTKLINSFFGLSPIAREIEQKNISFSVIKEDESLKIRINKVPHEAIIVGLYRRIIDSRQKFEKLRGISTAPIPVTSNSIIEFVDTDLVHDTYYEYKVFYIDRKNNEKESTNMMQHYYVSNNLSTSSKLKINNFEISKRDDYPYVSFKIDASITNDGVEFIKSFLLENNLDPGALGEISKNADLFKKLLVYNVDRQNLTSGEIESFGVITDPEFKDLSAFPDNLKTLKQFSLLDDYLYIVKLGIRDPAALLPTQQTVTESVDNRSSFLSKKYKFRLNLKKSTLPSKKTLESESSKSLKENFDIFYVGLEEYIKTSAEKYYPKVINTSVTRTYINYNLISWSIVGDANSIDHFRVYAIYDGVEASLGCAHSHTNDTIYFYEDHEMYDKIGVVTYLIKPVLLNFIEIEDVESVSIRIDSDAPSYLR